MVQSQMIEGTGEELIELLTRQPKERFRLIRLANDRPFQTYEEALAQAMSRTEEEIAEARTRVLQASPVPRVRSGGVTPRLGDALLS